MGAPAGRRRERSVARPTAILGLLATALILSACGSASVPSAIVASAPAPTPVVTPTAPVVAPSVPPSASASPVVRAITPDAVIPVPLLGAIAFDGAAFWVFTTSGAIGRLDPATNKVGALVTVDPTWKEGGLAVSPAGIWLSDFDASLAYRVNPSSLNVQAKIAVGLNPVGVAAGDGAIWVANHRGGTVTRIDPATNKIVATIAVGNPGRSGPSWIGLGLGSVWVGVPNASAVFRIDPVTNKIQSTITVPSEISPCSGFAFDEQAVWMPSCQDTNFMARIDPTTNKVVATIDLGGYGDDPVLVNGQPWLVVESTSGGPAQLVRINPATNGIDLVISLGAAFMGANLVVAAGSVWATDWANNQVLRLPMAAFSP
jgi:virginiamycin B lyase